MDELRVEFTRHALKKLKHRGLNEQRVIRTVFNPEKLILENNKFCAFRKYDNLYLKVIFKRLGNVAIIITQHLTGKFK